MSMAFKRYIEKSGLVFDSPEERMNAWREWKRGQKVYETTRTQQGQKDETDINKIMGRLDKKGIARLKSQVQVDEVNVADYSGMDYQKSMEMIAKIQSTFEALPSAVRKTYNNDPEAYYKELMKPTPAVKDIQDNIDQAQKRTAPEPPGEPQSGNDPSPEG